MFASLKLYLTRFGLVCIAVALDVQQRISRKRRACKEVQCFNRKSVSAESAG